MERPTGVTVLAGLSFLGAGLCVLGGLDYAALVGLSAVGGVLLLVCAAIGVVAGIGLWKLRGWARMVTIVLTILSLVLAVPGLFMSIFSLKVPQLIFQLIGAGICGLIVWYMFRPHVKQAFGVA